MALSRDDASRAMMAFQRFGLGAKPGGMTADVAKDPRAALRHEIGDGAKLRIDDPQLLTTQAALAQHFEEQKIVRLARETDRDASREMQAARGRLRSGGDGSPGVMTETESNPMQPGAPAVAPPGQASRQARQQNPQIEQIIYRNEALARMRKAGEPEIGFGERLALFWSNHFCVSVQKGQIARATAGALEREAVRPHVFGKFADMLLAVEKHPAMLFYLDNRQSVGPGSRAGNNRRAGLNENLAREILELHTLGVDGGYTQVDVTALARIITGWTFTGAAERLGPAGTFLFAPNRHEPGEQKLLGRIYSDTGVGQGETALRDIARHPSTARHIARKLVRHFVSEDAPPALVEQLARVFRETQGDLGQVSRALIDHDDAWKGDLVKIRTPYEWLAAITRFSGPPKDFSQILQPLAVLGAPLWAVPGPNGYPDTSAHWGSPESIRSRLDLSAVIGRRLGDRFNPSELGEQLFASALSTETAQAIRRAESKHQGLAILMMSPEFQRR
ncbi:MAG: DUF1800 family protein [Beijerinckiaceae bacterium]